MSPVAPTESRQCTALSAAYQDVRDRVSRAHDDCLKGSSGQAEAGRTCSSASCQSLHDERGQVSQHASAAVSDCQNAVSAYLRETRIRDAQRQASGAHEESYKADLAAKEAQRRAAAARTNGQQSRDSSRAADLARTARAKYDQAMAALAAAKQASAVITGAAPVSPYAELQSRLSELTGTGLAHAPGDVAFGPNSTRSSAIVDGTADILEASRKFPNSNPVSARLSEIGNATAVDTASRSLSAFESGLAAFESGLASTTSAASPSAAGQGAGPIGDVDFAAFQAQVGGQAHQLSGQMIDARQTTEGALRAAGVSDQVQQSSQSFDTRIRRADRAIDAQVSFDHRVTSAVVDGMNRAAGEAAMDSMRRNRSGSSSSFGSSSTSNSTHSSQSVRGGGTHHCSDYQQVGEDRVRTHCYGVASSAN